MEYNEKEYPGHKEIEMVGEKKQRPCWKIGLKTLFCMLTEGVFQAKMLLLSGPI